MVVLGDSISTFSSSTTQLSGGSLIAVLAVSTVLILFYIAAAWKIFTKAGRPGWLALIPIVNTFVLCQIAGRPSWWIILFFLPAVNAIATIWMLAGLSKAFGHGTGFTLGLIFLSPIFMPILAFGSSQYQPAGYSGSNYYRAA